MRSSPRVQDGPTRHAWATQGPEEYMVGRLCVAEARCGQHCTVLSTPRLENLHNSIEKKGDAFALIFFYTLQPNTSG